MIAKVAIYRTGQLVSVLTPLPIDRAYDYCVPPEIVLSDGDMVEVAVGPNTVIGVVWGPGAGDANPAKLKDVTRKLDLPPMGQAMRRFLQKAADYTLTPLGAMLRLATRAPDLGKPPKPKIVYRLGAERPDRATAARERVFEALEAVGGAAMTAAEIANAAGVSAGVVKGLAAAGALITEERARAKPFPKLGLGVSNQLSDAQSEAAAQMCAAVAARRFETQLLKGVTGSGKTEVYMEAVAECLAQGRQALILLPEIALTASFIERVEARFGARPAEWHSEITGTHRRRVWVGAAAGDAQLVVGARSALFLPFKDLGLIVVDEEHDGSYKQEDGALYSARDMSVLRASLCQSVTVLASATPSLESWGEC